MRALLLMLSIALSGCDTRPTCEVVCGNEVRCGLRDEASCPSVCAANLAMASSDCRVAADAYHRCWAARNTCPVSTVVAAPGCSSEFNQRALQCVTGSPLTTDGI